MASFREVIEDPDVREVHRQVRRREFLPHMSEHGTFQADLLFLDAYKHQNNRYTGLLTIVNVPSRFGYAVPFRNKSDTTEAFDTFLLEAHHNNQDVTRLETDNGSEFLNAKFQALLKKHNIKHTTGVSGDHRFSSVVERFNGSLRNWIEQYLTTQKVNRWIDAMPEIIEFYNDRKHRTLGVAPSTMTREDEDDLRGQMYDATEAVRDQVNSVQPGDRVRVLLHKKAFGKGRLRWSDNVYTIQERMPHSYTFRLKETPTLYKYSDIQLVRDDSHDIRPKTAETNALAANRAHALRFSRSGLARGVNEAEAVIKSVRLKAAVPPQTQTYSGPATPKYAPAAAGPAATTYTPEEPRRNPGRQRTVPARLRVDLGELRPTR